LTHKILEVDQLTTKKLRLQGDIFAGYPYSYGAFGGLISRGGGWIPPRLYISENINN